MVHGSVDASGADSDVLVKVKDAIVLCLDFVTKAAEDEGRGVVQARSVLNKHGKGGVADQPGNDKVGTEGAV